MITGSPALSEANVTLARLHLETALKLTSREYIMDWLTATPKPLTPVAETIQLVESSPKITVKRGRKPGAATPESRCIWKMTTGDLCKNGRHGTSEYCKIHISKTHIIAPTPQ